MPTDTYDQQSDAQLNEAFAVAYGGWQPRSLARGDKVRHITARWELAPVTRPGAQTFQPTVIRYKDGRYGGDVWPTYSTDANALLPWMDQGSAECHRLHSEGGKGRQWQVEVWPDRGRRGCGVATTFARAAVIALLRAHAAKGERS